ncbi:hypothetical protein A9K97_gp048 [Tokyovirus A1]|uniref:hypothetical protein n=1 Tax=Tokyovirus A1 TaxID=1826170 RepID=UPI0007A96092|nr:hypothetical protein A9K97_gp048 [Tokyovirus A1]BAU80303.1 hypothetical protein [Tokyovirus A1]
MSLDTEFFHVASEVEENPEISWEEPSKPKRTIWDISFSSDDEPCEEDAEQFYRWVYCQKKQKVCE